MPIKLTPRHALDELAIQHAMLRDLIGHCDELADQVDAGTGDAAALVGEVARLRAALDAHNRFEEQILHPQLIDADWSGAVRVARMVEDHVEEHRAMQRGLGGAPTAELRGVLASLRDHLAAEERHFLSRKVLRDDLPRGGA